MANVHGRGRPLSALVTTLQIGAGNALVHSFAQILFNQHDENRNNQDQGQDSNQHHDVLPDVAPVLGHPVELLGYVRNVLLIDIVDIRIGHVVIIRLAPQAWGRVVDVYRPFLNRLVDFEFCFKLFTCTSVSLRREKSTHNVVQKQPCLDYSNNEQTSLSTIESHVLLESISGNVSIYSTNYTRANTLQNKLTQLSFLLIPQLLIFPLSCHQLCCFPNIHSRQNH